MSDDDIDGVRLEVTTLGDTGELRTVMLGAGSPGVLIIPQPDGDGVLLKVTVGELEVGDLAAMLYGIAVTLDPTLKDEDPSEQ